MNESFFVSDSLKDLIDEQLLMDEEFKKQLDTASNIDIAGKFVSVELDKNLMTLEVNQKIAKALLANSQASFVFSFMEENWFLSPHDMKLHQDKDGKYYATLQITDRQKEDTYERTV